MFLLRACLFLSLVCSIACGSPDSGGPDPAPVDPGPSAGDESVEPDDVAIQEPAPTPAPHPMALQRLTRATLEGEPSLRITAPTEGALIRRGSVTVSLRLRDFELSPPPGNHVHLSVDGGREMAVTDASSPIALEALVEEATGEPLAPGSHVLRAFLGRADHESVKRAEATAVVVFHYRERTRGFTFDRRAPALIYSRPQGCSSSTARLLDFQLANIERLSPDGYRVRYAIDDLRGEIAEWVPHRISGLRPGVHTVELALLDADGDVVAGSEQSRTFRVDPDCPTYAVRPYEPSAAEDDDDDQSM